MNFEKQTVRMTSTRNDYLNLYLHPKSSVQFMKDEFFLQFGGIAPLPPNKNRSLDNLVTPHEVDNCGIWRSLLWLSFITDNIRGGNRRPGADAACCMPPDD